MKLQEAIAKIEGFYIVNSRAARNNNPGNIEYGAFAKAHGADRIETTNPSIKARFAHFPTPEIGFECLIALLSSKYAELTIEQAINKYAPPVENNTTNYVALVCKWLGAQPTDLVKQYI